MNDYYQILEVEPNASLDQITNQWKFLMQAWHPDKFGSPESKAKAEEKCKQINEAFNILKDPVKRQDYDHQTHEQNRRKRREKEAQAEAEKRQNERVKKDQSHYQNSRTNDQSKNENRKIYLYPGVVILVVFVSYLLLRNQFPPSRLPTSTPAVVIASAIPFAPTCPESVAISTLGAQVVATDKAIPTPEIQETNKVCVAKIPYTALRITEGSEFVSLDPAFKCKEELTKNGYTVISCNGEPSSSFDLRVCIPSSGLGKCSQDMTFDSKNQCCVPSRPQDVGCTTFKVDIRSCP